MRIPALALLWLAAAYACWQLLSDPHFNRTLLCCRSMRRGCCTAPFFERYAGLFPGKWTMIVASAAAFAFMHTIFRNWLAVALTFAGGLLFAARFAETGSLAASGFEHALYGCWLFTVGLGQYFYHGTIATVATVMRS